MPDSLYLSLWLRGFDQHSMLQHFGRLLSVFPFSHLRQGISSLRVDAIEFAEPPQLEQAFAGAADVEAVIDLADEFRNADCAYTVNGWWELWQYDQDWTLSPARVALTCFGSEFDNDVGEHLRIDLGPESHYLPRPETPDSVRPVRSNLQSVVRLARELAEALPVQRRRLWSESGEDFASRLDEAMEGAG